MSTTEMIGWRFKKPGDVAAPSTPSHLYLSGSALGNVTEAFIK